MQCTVLVVQLWGRTEVCCLGGCLDGLELASACLAPSHHSLMYRSIMYVRTVLVGTVRETYTVLIGIFGKNGGKSGMFQARGFPASWMGGNKGRKNPKLFFSTKKFVYIFSLFGPSAFFSPLKKKHSLPNSEWLWCAYSAEIPGRQKTCTRVTECKEVGFFHSLI